MNKTKEAIKKFAIPPGLIMKPQSSGRVKKLCRICKEPMLVAPGQIAYYHKACRKLRNKKNR